MNPTWLRGAVVALALAGQVLPSAVSGRELRLSHQWPETDARHRAARVIAAELKRRMPELSLRIYPNSSLEIDPVGQYDAVLDRTIDMAIYPLSYLASKVPEMA